MKLIHRPPLPAVRVLLATAQLPASDITAEVLRHFLGAWEGGRLYGIVGLEPLGEMALLRSLAVADGHRHQGLGSRLLEAMEQYAEEQDVVSLYLLTTNAVEFFQRRGYREVARDAAPRILRSTSEFSHLCPASAIVMSKRLRAG